MHNEQEILASKSIVTMWNDIIGFQRFQADYSNHIKYEAKYYKISRSDDPPLSVSQKRTAIANGNDLRGLGTCHQQAFWQEYRKRIPIKIRNLTEDCIACRLASWPKHPFSIGQYMQEKMLILTSDRRSLYN